MQKRNIKQTRQNTERDVGDRERERESEDS